MAFIAFLSHVFIKLFLYRFLKIKLKSKMTSNQSTVNLWQLFNELHRFEQSSDFDKALKVANKSQFSFDLTLIFII